MAERDPVAELLAAHNEGAEPPGDWQAKVWAEIARQDDPKSSGSARWIRWVLAGVGVATAAAILALALRPPASGPASLSVAVVDGAGTVRSAGVNRGDRLQLEATLGGADHGALRVYRDDATIVLDCSGPPRCAREGDRLTGAVELAAVGRYQVLLLTSASPIPEPAQTLESELAQSRQAGVEVETTAAIEVY